MKYPINLTLDQIETLILACGIAASNSTLDTAWRCRRVRSDLIHAKVIAEYVELDVTVTSELCAKLHSAAEYGKVCV